MYSYYMYMQCDTWNYIWWQCTHIMLPKKRIKITKVSLAQTSLSFYLLKYLPAKDSILVWKILPEFHYIYITVSAFLFGFTVDICFWQMCKGTCSTMQFFFTKIRFWFLILKNVRPLHTWKCLHMHDYKIVVQITYLYLLFDIWKFRYLYFAKFVFSKLFSWFALFNIYFEYPKVWETGALVNLFFKKMLVTVKRKP